jgi:hypothetical protein
MNARAAQLLRMTEAEMFKDIDGNTAQAAYTGRPVDWTPAQSFIRPVWLFTNDELFTLQGHYDRILAEHHSDMPLHTAQILAIAEVLNKSRLMAIPH